jgi:hypothetical protein
MKPLWVLLAAVLVSATLPQEKLFGWDRTQHAGGGA